MVASEQHSYQKIVLPRKLATVSIHDHLFCYCPLVGILAEVLRIDSDHLIAKPLNYKLRWASRVTSARENHGCLFKKKLTVFQEKNDSMVNLNSHAMPGCLYCERGV